MRVLLAALLFGLPFAAAAQQPKPPAEIQPQVWPPPQTSSPQAAPAQPAQVPAAPTAEPAPRGPAAQKPAPQPRSGQIQLDVVVTDKAGHPITGLQRGDFTLLDDNRPTEIQSFQAFTASRAAPTNDEHIILIIDAVNIDFRDVAFSRFGIDNFLRSKGGRLPAPMSIYWYTDTGLEGDDTPTSDGNALAAKLDATQSSLRSLNRSAGAWGAIERFEMSVQMLDRIVQKIAGLPGRKMLIWVGPGWPILDSPSMQMTWNQQQHLFDTIVKLSTFMREGQLSVYSVTQGMPNQYTFLYQSYLKGVKKATQAQLPNLDLKVLAVQSGGRALVPSNDLGAEIEDCIQDAEAWYVISFTPPPADGPNEYHELKVRVDKPGLTARTDTGYYNQPPGMRLGIDRK